MSPRNETVIARKEREHVGDLRRRIFELEEQNAKLENLLHLVEDELMRMNGTATAGIAQGAA